MTRPKRLFNVFVSDGTNDTNAIIKAVSHAEAKKLAYKVLELTMEIHILSKAEQNSEDYDFLRDPKVMEEIDRKGGYIYDQGT